MLTLFLWIMILPPAGLYPGIMCSVVAVCPSEVIEGYDWLVCGLVSFDYKILEVVLLTSTLTELEVMTY